jgi:hypothetical protein
MNFEEHMNSGKAEYWEKAYFEFVCNGSVGIDEWILHWFWNNIKFPKSKEYSIFSPNIFINSTLLNVKIQLSSFHQGKNRYLKMSCLNNSDYYPFFEFNHSPDEMNNRFESVGNPMIDNINYRSWEEYLVYKLLTEILFENGGMDAIVEGIRRNL